MDEGTHSVLIEVKMMMFTSLLTSIKTPRHLVAIKEKKKKKKKKDPVCTLHTLSQI